MIEQRIPYVIYGGIKFYERAEIKDALCYLRMVCGSNDLALMRIINVPRRGAGQQDDGHDRAAGPRNRQDDVRGYPR